MSDGKVDFEEIPVFRICRQACRDSSLYFFFLVLFLEAVVLPHVGHLFNMATIQEETTMKKNGRRTSQRFPNAFYPTTTLETS